MATTYYATNIFLADGIKTEWDFSFAGVDDASSVAGIVPYLYPEDVKAAEIYFDEAGEVVTIPRALTLTGANRALITGLPIVSGHTVKIYRQTEIRFPLVNYRDRQSVSELDLDLANRQAIFIAQETLDVSADNFGLDALGNFDAQDHQIINLRDGVGDNDAVNVNQVRAWRSTFELNWRFLEPTDGPTQPTLRDNGEPLETGDQWMDKISGIVYNRRAGTWEPGNIDALALAGAGGAGTVGYTDSLAGVSTVQAGIRATEGRLTTAESDINAVEASVVAVQNAAAAYAADNVTNKASPLMSRSHMVTTSAHMMNVLGDSISAVCYSGNAYSNGWVSLLAKAVNGLFGARNLGAIPMDPMNNADPTYVTNQLHTVSYSGNWGTRAAGSAPFDFPVGLQGSAAGDAINGKTFQSSTSGAYFEIEVPSMNALAFIYYVGRPGAGSFNVTVNGGAPVVLNTANATVAYNKTYPVNCADNGQGISVIRFTKTDNLLTEIQSVVRYQKANTPATEHFQLANVCNFSVSGRQMVSLTEAAISAAANCGALVMALGYNDLQAETDDTYYTNLLTRVNWIIQYANQTKCLVVVPDFCWYSAPTSRVRTQLKRIATETRGIYIGFPDKLRPDGVIPVDPFPTASELVTTLRMWADNAHPNFKGNEWIFHHVALALGLGVNTRRQALLQDMPFPLRLQGTLKNAGTRISSISRTSNGYIYSLAVDAGAGGNIPITGSLSVAVVPARFQPVVSGRYTLTATGYGAAGAALGYASVGTFGVGGQVNATIITASVINCTIVVLDDIE
jgi:hypothetical protein